MVLPYMIRSSSFYHLNQSPDGQSWRTRHRQMDVIVHDLFCKEVNVVSRTQPIQRVQHQLTLMLLSEDRISIFWYQDNIIPVLSHIM